MNTSSADALLELLSAKLGPQILKKVVNLGDAEVFISRTNVEEFFNILKLDSDLRFDLLISVTAVDFLDLSFLPRVEETRFQVVYHLLSIKHLHRLRVKVELPEEDPKIPSIQHIWASADFMEREVWDMYGVVFTGHPDLRRTLLYEEFVGHPLRKDYPVQGKQPRIPMRSPEVHNTARDMIRPDLVRIRSRQEKEEQQALAQRHSPSSRIGG